MLVGLRCALIMLIVTVGKTHGFIRFAKHGWLSTALTRGIAFHKPLQQRPKNQMGCARLMSNMNNKEPMASLIVEDNQRNKRLTYKKFYDAVGSMNYEAAVDSLEEIKRQKHLFHPNELFAFLKVCHKAEHLDKAIKITNMLKSRNLQLSPGNFMCLIRCYTSAGRLNESIDIINEMVANKMELQPRLFQPILHSLSESLDLKRFLELIDYMIKLKVVINEEQITTMLSMLGHDQIRKEIQDNEYIRDKINAIMVEAAKELFGVYHDNVKQIVRTINGISPEEVEDLGVLVAQFSDISGDILSSSLWKDGVVTAMNATYPDASTMMRRYPTALARENAADISSHDGRDNNLIPEKYVVLYRNDTRELLVDDISRNKELPARIVEISSHTLSCPNCNQVIEQFHLSEEDKHRVRKSLYKQIEASHAHDSSKTMNSLQVFSQF